MTQTPQFQSNTYVEETWIVTLFVLLLQVSAVCVPRDFLGLSCMTAVVCAKWDAYLRMMTCVAFFVPWILEYCALS